MGKLLSHIQNYPLSDGAVPYSNHRLLKDHLAIRTNSLKDYLKTIYEFSKDIHFFNGQGIARHTWNDLLAKDPVFQLARLTAVPVQELDRFFTGLAQTNGFTSDTELTEAEYATLAYQRLQVVQSFFWQYKTTPATISGESQLAALLNNPSVNRLFVAYQALLRECMSEPSVLIPEERQIPVQPFQGMRFPVIDESLTTSLQAFFNPGNVAGQPVLEVYSNSYDKLKAANEYVYVIFKGLLSIQQTFARWAETRLHQLSTSTDNHQPHISLLISFCRLAMLYDTRFNRLAEENTAFVYRDILHLQKQPVMPDSAYVCLELAKNSTTYFLPENTLFKAGKNKDNKPVYYRSRKGIVLNNAQISAIKSAVLVRGQNGLLAVAATPDAAAAEWQVNGAWMPFNDINESYTGLAMESKLLETLTKEGSELEVRIRFGADLPLATGLEEKLQAVLLLQDDTDITLKVSAATIKDDLLKITASVPKDLKVAVKTGLNLKLALRSPAGDENSTDNHLKLYQFLLEEEITKISVGIKGQTFAPARVRTSMGLIDGESSFAAFGAQSLAGTSFRIHHPFIRYASTLDVTVEWTEKLKESVPVSANGKSFSFPANAASGTLSLVPVNGGASVAIELKTDHTYVLRSTHKGGPADTTVETVLPRVLLVKSLKLRGDLEEAVYTSGNDGPLLFVEEVMQSRYRQSLRLPFAGKEGQRKKLLEQYRLHQQKTYRYHRNNRLAHLYPLGERALHKTSGLTFLPDYSVLGFSTYTADLYIGLTGIQPGQSISLLFDIAEETAGQSAKEATITWHFIADESIEALDPSGVVDTTRHFLQPGIVQLTLPPLATSSNKIVYGKDMYWLVARCTKNYGVVGNIRSIKTNAVEVQRVMDAGNNEALRSVAPATIENLYPKSAHVKSVTQDTPSFGGRETETDQHYFWRSSQRLRHKQRAVNQWDFEHLLLEKFSDIYKVKCLNHAYADEASGTLIAKPGHVILSVIPYYRINRQNPNFQPAVPLSKLQEILSFIKQKSSPFIRYQVLNTAWDPILLQLEVVLQAGVQDLLFYRDELNNDIRKFFSPWAFEQTETPLLQKRIYVATLLDFIDELPYVHHIRLLKVFRNDTEVFDEITSSTEIHLLTTANDHNITVLQYGTA